MIRYLRVLALGAFFVPAAILAGCGEEGLPGNAVAEVDGTDDREGRLRALARHRREVERAAGSRRCPSRPSSPSASRRRRRPLRSPPQGQPKQTDADYKKQCQQQYDQLREQTLGLLISFEWIEREAEEQGVKVTDAEVKKSLDDQNKQSYPKDADFQKFLEQSGFTNEDLLKRVRLDVLVEQDPRQGDQGQGQGLRRAGEELLRLQPAAVRAARAARPEHRADQDRRPRPRRPRRRWSRGSRSSRSSSSTPRRRLQGPGRQAAGGRGGSAGEGVRHCDLRRQEGQDHRSGQDAVRLLRLQGRQGQPRRRSRRSRRRRRRSSRCSPHRTSRRRSTRSSRTSASSGRRRPSVARAT